MVFAVLHYLGLAEPVKVVSWEERYLAGKAVKSHSSEEKP